MTRAPTTKPEKPGHAAAQAWYCALQARLESEKDRTGVINQVPAHIVPVWLALEPSAQADFIDAVGALIVAMITIGDPAPGRWDPAGDIAEFAEAWRTPGKESEQCW